MDTTQQSPAKKKTHKELRLAKLERDSAKRKEFRTALEKAADEGKLALAYLRQSIVETGKSFAARADWLWEQHLAWKEDQSQFGLTFHDYDTAIDLLRRSYYHATAKRRRIMRTDNTQPLYRATPSSRGLSEDSQPAMRSLGLTGQEAGIYSDCKPAEILEDVAQSGVSGEVYLGLADFIRAQDQTFLGFPADCIDVQSPATARVLRREAQSELRVGSGKSKLGKLKRGETDWGPADGTLRGRIAAMRDTASSRNPKPQGWTINRVIEESEAGTITARQANRILGRIAKQLKAKEAAKLVPCVPLSSDEAYSTFGTRPWRGVKPGTRTVLNPPVVSVTYIPAGCPLVAGDDGAETREVLPEHGSRIVYEVEGADCYLWSEVRV